MFIDPSSERPDFSFQPLASPQFDDDGRHVYLYAYYLVQILVGYDFRVLTQGMFFVPSFAASDHPHKKEGFLANLEARLPGYHHKE